MAKAQITLAGGIVVSVSGTPEEVTAVISRLQGGGSTPKDSTSTTARSRPKNSSGRVQITELIEQLIEAGFFKKPKDLAAVKVALEEMGHHYPVTTLSPTMLRQVRKRNLRRLKEGSRWVYTG
jgi:hypothetical protein